MRAAGQRLTRRLERHRLDRRQGLGLGEPEHECGLEEHAPLAGLLALLVALLDGDGARILSAFSFLRTHLPSFSQVRNPATRSGTIPRSWHCKAISMQLPAEYEWNIARTRTQRAQPSENSSSSAARCRRSRSCRLRSACSASDTLRLPWP